MEHTFETVGNIFTTIKSLENAFETITGDDDEAKKVRAGIKSAREYIFRAINADRKVANMFLLYKEMNDRGLTSIDISDRNVNLEPAYILSILEEFGIGKFTMSMSNKYTTDYAAYFCNNGFTVTRVCRLNDGKSAFEFEQK